VQIPRGDAVALTRALVAIDSRNPTLVPGAPGERSCAQFLGGVLRDWGFDVQLMEQVPGRPNLLARLGPAGSGNSALMLAGHLDVVGVEGMTHSPFDADLRDGRIYGRGAADMKGGIAAMCSAAVRAISEDSRKPVLIAAVVDEEYESLGMRALLAEGVRAEAAILTEPTRLAICPAHRGFVWMDVTFRGRAAHGSRYDLGVDAITHAGLFLAELDQLERGREKLRTHALLGRGSLHASTISGGVGMSTYPELCELALERRTLPGETAEDALREVRDALERVRAQEPRIHADVKLNTSQAPSDVAIDSPVVQRLASALRAEKIAPAVEGLSAWTDAALLNEAGIPAICFGPGDIALAHSAEEWVPVAEVESATRVLERFVADWCN
jgi:acetylornithine deacetylase or succinyl-diaminopimelate desuccinylase